MGCVPGIVGSTQAAQRSCTLRQVIRRERETDDKSSKTSGAGLREFRLYSTGKERGTLKSYVK